MQTNEQGLPVRQVPAVPFLPGDVVARHGDVLLIAVDQVPSGATLKESAGELVLALGEVTGHAHRLRSVEAYLWEKDGQRYVQVGEPSLLTHEEHGVIEEIPPGAYEVRIQRVYSPEEIRNVVD